MFVDNSSRPVNKSPSLLKSRAGGRKPGKLNVFALSHKLVGHSIPNDDWKRRRTTCGVKSNLGEKRARARWEGNGLVEKEREGKKVKAERAKGAGKVKKNEDLE